MGFSPDKMLQGRLFAYHDAQLYRVGTNHQHLPVNARAAHSTINSAMDRWRFSTGDPPELRSRQRRGHYAERLRNGDPGWPLTGDAGRYDERGASDDFTQAGNLYRVMTPDARDRLTTNIAGAMKTCRTKSRGGKSATSRRPTRLMAPRWNASLPLSAAPQPERRRGFMYSLAEAPLVSRRSAATRDPRRVRCRLRDSAD